LMHIAMTTIQKAALQRAECLVIEACKSPPTDWNERKELVYRTLATFGDAWFEANEEAPRD
jgi:hypothetical protein